MPPRLPAGSRRAVRPSPIRRLRTAGAGSINRHPLPAQRCGEVERPRPVGHRPGQHSHGEGWDDLGLSDAVARRGIGDGGTAYRPERQAGLGGRSVTPHRAGLVGLGGRTLLPPPSADCVGLVGLLGKCNHYGRKPAKSAMTPIILLHEPWHPRGAAPPRRRGSHGEQGCYRAPPGASGQSEEAQGSEAARGDHVGRGEDGAPSTQQECEERQVVHRREDGEAGRTSRPRSG